MLSMYHRNISIMFQSNEWRVSSWRSTQGRKNEALRVEHTKVPDTKRVSKSIALSTFVFISSFKLSKQQILWTQWHSPILEVYCFCLVYKYLIPFLRMTGVTNYGNFPDVQWEQQVSLWRQVESLPNWSHVNNHWATGWILDARRHHHTDARTLDARRVDAGASESQPGWNVDASRWTPTTIFQMKNSTKTTNFYIFMFMNKQTVFF